MSDYDRISELQAFDDTKAGVKGLVEAGVTKIPRIFIHEQYINEEKTTSDASVPVVDLACLEKDRRGVVDQVRSACREWGFFKILNHGIPADLMNKVMEVVKEFFELDGEDKKQYYTRDIKRKVGFNSNFDLFRVPYANWRDTLYLVMAPNPPQPHELPQVCRYISHFL